MRVRFSSSAPQQSPWSQAHGGHQGESNTSPRSVPPDGGAAARSHLAAAVELDRHQIRRYEAGEAQPTLPVAKATAHALGISLDELAGEANQRLTVTGDWWANWETCKDHEEVHTSQPIQIRQRGSDSTSWRLTGGSASRKVATCGEDNCGYGTTRS